MGSQEFLVEALLRRAEYFVARFDRGAAERDLREALHLAQTSEMKLAEIDCRLTDARTALHLVAPRSNATADERSFRYVQILAPPPNHVLEPLPHDVRRDLLLSARTQLAHAGRDIGQTGYLRRAEECERLTREVGRLTGA